MSTRIRTKGNTGNTFASKDPSFDNKAIAITSFAFVCVAGYTIYPDFAIILSFPYALYLHKLKYFQFIMPVLFGLGSAVYFIAKTNHDIFFVHLLFCIFCLLVEWLDPEPFFLLSLHTIISCLMLHDTITTLAIIMAVSVTCLTASSMEVSSERIAVFLVSMALSCMLGTITSIIAAVALMIAIIGLKLRPLRAASNYVLGLLLLAASVPINGHVTSILSSLMAVVLTTWYFIERFHAKTELLYLDQNGGHQISSNNNNNNISSSNNNNNGRLTLMNGGQLKLSSTTDSLDLHGHTVTSALKTLHQFLKEHEDSYRADRSGHARFLKVITGEDGKNHPEDNLNLIKPTVANFLKINKYRFQVHPDRPGIMKIDLESHV